jgi:hypothetical protein
MNALHGAAQRQEEAYRCRSSGHAGTAPEPGIARAHRLFSLAALLRAPAACFLFPHPDAGLLRRQPPGHCAMLKSGRTPQAWPAIS